MVRIAGELCACQRLTLSVGGAAYCRSPSFGGVRSGYPVARPPVVCYRIGVMKDGAPARKRHRGAGKRSALVRVRVDLPLRLSLDRLSYATGIPSSELVREVLRSGLNGRIAALRGEDRARYEEAGSRSARPAAAAPSPEGGAACAA